MKHRFLNYIIAWSGNDEYLNVGDVQTDGVSITGFGNKVTLKDSSDDSPTLASLEGGLYIGWHSGDGHLNVMYSADNGNTFVNKYTSPEETPRAPVLCAHEWFIIFPMP